jgi:hypothetical protein
MSAAAQKKAKADGTAEKQAAAGEDAKQSRAKAAKPEAETSAPWK